MLLFGDILDIGVLLAPCAGVRAGSVLDGVVEGVGAGLADWFLGGAEGDGSTSLEHVFEPGETR